MQLVGCVLNFYFLCIIMIFVRLLLYSYFNDFDTSAIYSSAGLSPQIPNSPITH